MNEKMDGKGVKLVLIAVPMNVSTAEIGAPVGTFGITEILDHTKAARLLSDHTERSVLGEYMVVAIARAIARHKSFAEAISWPVPVGRELGELTAEERESLLAEVRRAIDKPFLDIQLLHGVTLEAILACRLPAEGAA